MEMNKSSNFLKNLSNLTGNILKNLCSGIGHFDSAINSPTSLDFEYTGEMNGTRCSSPLNINKNNKIKIK